MALLSKLLEDFSNVTGIPAIGLTRAVYSAAIIGYIAKVVIPGLKLKQPNNIIGKTSVAILNERYQSQSELFKVTLFQNCKCTLLEALRGHHNRLTSFPQN